MSKVISYLATLPASKTPESIAKNVDKNNTLRYFIEGVNKAGDTGTISDKMIWEPADVAVMLGWVHENSKTSPHLEFRRKILESQLKIIRRTVIADSNLFLYKNTDNPGYWLRYSFDGVFPDTGEYCDSNPDPDRWITIQKELGVALKDYRTNGNHILLCLQRDGGWSMGNLDVVDWALQTINEIRKYSDRTIIVRGHPGDKRAEKYLPRLIKLCTGRNIPNVYVSPAGRNLLDDLRNCWAVVNHNSSPAVAAILEGVPVFVTDPTRSQCRDVANTRIEIIENPVLLDRQGWAERISQFHWSHAELKSGQCWTHMREWIKK